MKRKPQLPGEYVAELIRLYTVERLSAVEIGRRVGRDPSGLRRVLKSRGVVIRDATECDRRYRLNEAAFDVVTDVSAYWCGYLMADGNVYQSGPRCWSVQASAAEKDISHLEKLAAFLGTDTPIRVRDQGPRSYAGGRQAVLYVRSERLALSLVAMGVVPRKSFIAEAAESVARSPHFWRGVVDGDGCVRWTQIRSVVKGRVYSYRVPSVTLSSGSVRLLEQYAAFCKTVAPGRRFTIHKRNTCDYVQTGYRTACAIAKALYVPGHVALDRKAQTAAEFFDWGQ